MKPVLQHIRGQLPQHAPSRRGINECCLTSVRTEVRLRIPQAQFHFRQLRHRLRHIVHEQAQVMQSFAMVRRK